MRYPSVDTLQKTFNLERNVAIKFRKLLDGRLDPMTFESVHNWVRQCYHMPMKRELKMEAANELLNGHGVEAINAVDHIIPRAVYVNMGDTYKITLLYDTSDSCYRIMSYGDFIEWRERKGEKF